MIIITLNKRDFEYDVHSLVKAFFPSETAAFQEEGEESVRLRISVFYEINEIRITLQTPEGVLLSEESVSVSENEERTQRKNALKSLLYRMLSSYTGQKLPWGNLTGIRPVKIPMELLREGWSNGAIAAHMREKYFVSTSRSALAISIANREKHLLDILEPEKGYSLYMGIPFCPTICLYCSFSSSPISKWRDKVENYLGALMKEMDAVSEMFRGKTLQTVYIGGGTPTTLTPDQMNRLITHAREVFDFSSVREFTVEAGRPDTITEEMLRVLKDQGVTRISINPQTMNQKTLDVIGRHHTVPQIEEAYQLARSMGFDNINMDLIVGLPGEEMADVQQTMQRVIDLKPDNVTVHSLALKRAARLSRMKDVYESISFHNNSEIMDMTTHLLEEAGLAPYYLYRQKNMAGNFENVGYAAEGKEGLYNILIMEEVQSIVALGAGTVSKCVHPDGLIERCDNVKDILMYIERIDEMIDRKKILYGICDGQKVAHAEG